MIREAGIMRRISLALEVGTAAISMSRAAIVGKDLDAIKARGSVACGVMEDTAGFAMADVLDK
jgi:general L-amino acid transport system substrate-binding protein